MEGMRVLAVVFAAGAIIAGSLFAITGTGPGPVGPSETGSASPAPPGRTIAVTIDDLPGVSRSGTPDDYRKMNDAMLEVLVQERVPAIGFVTEGRLEAAGSRERGRDILTRWLDAGMSLGNHTHGHRGLTNTPPDEYERDILRGEQITRPLVEARGGALEFFRHPMTQTGPTEDIRQRINAFLVTQGYRVAPFTIEDADYVFALIYDDAVARGDAELADRTAAAYLEHQARMFDWFEELSRDTFDREIPQILLIHVNRLHARTLADEVAAIQARGYRFVSLDEAMTDAAYRTRDGFVGNYGPSWFHRWRLALDMPDRLRDEPDPPAWVMEAFERLQ